ncbi:MAG TPA: DUF4159 domain-containing protein [Lacunisphaera sp.]|nr:DUF4159 domain-containing protein [Lacunisphaera sp.]
MGIRFGQFLRIAACGALFFAGLASHPLAAQEDVFRGGRVGWARLQTTDEYWRRHSETDTRLSAFIRTRTSLNIDETWYTANVSRLDQLTAYPLIFANTLARVTDPADQRNLTEYLRRGGFLVVDACANVNINPSPETFLATNTKIFKTILPGCEIRQLPPNHEIYRCFFKMEETPPHTYHSGIFNPRWFRYGLQGVYVQDRLVSLITLSGLQCGWSGVPAEPDHHIRCMEMMCNIYVYAMTR